jgi:hypothetical protein
MTHHVDWLRGFGATRRRSASRRRVCRPVYAASLQLIDNLVEAGFDAGFVFLGAWCALSAVDSM